MITPADCLKKYGDPKLHTNMVMWDVPARYEIGVIPKRIYCNKDLIEPLEQGFKNIIERGFVDELKTWDGCFCIRMMRGINAMSLHSWGICFDVNAFENGLNAEPKLSAGFVQCFTDAGFEWGGNWKRKDGMHFQLKTI